MDRQEYESGDNWAGTYYELSIEYAPGGDDARVLPALHALWHTSLLSGPVAGPYREGTSHDVFAPVELPTSLCPEGGDTLYGLFHLPPYRPIGCLSTLTRLDSLEGEEQSSDWLSFCIPTGMLDLAFDVAYPILPSTNPWMAEVDRALIGIAESIYRASPFHVAVIGEEAAALAVDEADLTAEELARGGYLVSTSVVTRIAPRSPSIPLAHGLHWFPWPA